MQGEPKNGIGSTVGIQKVGVMAGVVDGLKRVTQPLILSSNPGQGRVLKCVNTSFQYEGHFFCPKLINFKEVNE